MTDRGAHKDRLARTFDRSAPLYERGRPDYPQSAIRFAAKKFDLRRGSTIVDLAAGTGKLTRSLRSTGAALVAVEPMPGMRRVFRRVVPGVPIVDGRAEAIPLPDGFADAVFVGQAFHWFRWPAAVREIARVLRPGGALVIVWNTRDGRTRLSRKLTEVVERSGRPTGVRRRAGGHRPRSGTSERAWRRAFRRGASPFTGLRKRTFSHSQAATPESLVARILSISYVAAQSPAVRRRAAQEVRTILAIDPTTRGQKWVKLVYRTEVFYCRKRPAPARPPR